MSNNYPLISNSREYMYTKKYVSIHSEDRDMKKYPNSGSFVLELPQDYLNVVTVKLESWSFPSNYSAFSIFNNNVSLSFQISKPYVFSPAITSGDTNTLQISYVITEIFRMFVLHNYTIIIDDGFYNPEQMANELTNRFNEVVTIFINVYLTQHIGEVISGISITQSLIDEFNNYDTGGYGGYTDFVIIYHTVSQKLLFGNRSSGFIIPKNNTTLNENGVLNTLDFEAKCLFKGLPDYSNYGLVSNLGFSPADNISIQTYPLRIFYVQPMAGRLFWLFPNTTKYPNSTVSYYIEPPYKINLMGQAYLYLELEGLNNIDETSPFDDTYAAETTTTTNSRVNAAFAKIPISTTPISQWFDHECKSFKLYNPPAERIRKLKIRLRYHDGLLAVFGVFNYSFTLEFTMLTPQQLKGFTTLYPNSIY